MKKSVYALIGGETLPSVAVTPPATAARTEDPDAIVIDATDTMQSWDGWGTALAWWANMYGDLTNIVEGQEQRKNITDMIFTDKGLNLNIARYNLGTYENPVNTSWDTVLNMPPVVKDPTDGNWEPGDPFEYELEYDLSNDANQRWVFDEFLRVQPDGITELWVNSPPYWMTVSGSASGNRPSGATQSRDNIAPEAYGTYASYLVDVLEEFASEGIYFDYIEPFNEPNSGYDSWYGPHSSNQVGYGEAQSGVLNALHDELVERGLQDTYLIAGTDELNTSQTAIAWGMMSEEAKNNVAKINTHTYSGTTEQTSMRNLKEAAYGEDLDYDNPQKKLWMSERTLHMGPEPESFYYGIALAQEIIDCINVMGVNAWCHWQATDELGVSERSTQWRYDMQFFTFGNFTRYITPGSTILNTGNETAAAALTPDNKIVVVTSTGLDESNPNSALNHDERNITIEIENAEVKSVSMVQTTAMSDSWEVESVAGETQRISATLPEVSVTTYIFEVGEVGSGCGSAFDGGMVALIAGVAAVSAGAAVALRRRKNKSTGGRDE